MENINLYKGDCLEVMDKLISENIQVDLTVTSPPYDNLRNYEDSLQWNEEIWKQVIERLYKITKNGGVVVWVVGDATIKGSETGTSFKQALYFKEIGFNLHDTMIWIKDGGGAVGSNKCYTQNFEYMFVFSKGKINTTNLIYDKPNASFGKDKSGVGRRLVTGEHKIEKRKPSAEFSRRNNYWYIAPQNGEHPAVFPEALANDHIISWSNEGDVVLDCFMGSGTTGKVAKQLKREFIGIEKVDKYFEMSKKRINNIQPTLF
ncbi:MAG: site-specific DNA-methyltransferase [Spirochaetes bacterium]|nr:MAG: site-specific DNA-methyltransferase [Spirochaetota bacterium]